MNTRARQSYADTQLETGVAAASSAELVVMVYDRLFEHLREAQRAMIEARDTGEVLGKALELITTGLQACLDHEQGGDVAANLSALYDWACREILRARLQRDAALLQKVIEVLGALADGWRELAAVPRPAVAETVGAPGTPPYGGAGESHVLAAA